MLTKAELDFIQYFKLTGNAGESLVKAGYTTNLKSARVMACRMLKRPEIAEIVTRASVNQVNQIINAPVNIKLPPKEYLQLPTKDEYLLKAWKRTDPGPSSMKEETQSKYFEIAGKALGVFSDGVSQQIMIYNPEKNQDSVNQIINPLLSLNETKERIAKLSASPPSQDIAT